MADSSKLCPHLHIPFQSGDDQILTAMNKKMRFLDYKKIVENARKKIKNLAIMINITKSILKEIYKPRPLNAVKYNYGLLLVIGGSEFYSGSPALAAMAGFRAGADMARIIAPERAANIIAGFSPTMAA